MLRRGSWIAAAGALCVAIVVALAVRGPVSHRAPVRGDASPAPAPPVAAGAALRVDVAASPPGSEPAWKLEVRDAEGRLHERSGTGAQSFAVGPVPAGRLSCAMKAPGFVGETRRLEAEQGRDLEVALVLRQFGRVSGSVRCEGAPLPGALVQLTMPPGSSAILADLSAADRGIAMTWSAEADSDGRYRFDRVPPAAGYSLVAADFDHPPGRRGPIEVLPGAEAIVDFTLVVGGHLSGRVVDVRGSPCAGATVNVLARNEKRGVVMWEDEARARTDEDGRFVTPALAAGAPRMLKVWIVAEGIQQVIQHVADPPERGTKDVGTLGPMPGVVRFETADPLPARGFTVAVVGAGDGAAGFALAGLPLDAEGGLRLAGLPKGEVAYEVANAEGRSVSEGRFEVTGRDVVVRIAPFHAPPQEKPEPAETLSVDAGDASEAALLLLVSGDRVVLWEEIPKGRHERIARNVEPGAYTLYVRAGDRIGQREVTQVAGRDGTVSIAADRAGRTFGLRVLDGGQPVTEANVFVCGFAAGARGQRAPWTKTGEDGLAALRGLPPDAAALEITVLLPDGYGRSYTVEIAGKDDATVDLASQSGD